MTQFAMPVSMYMTRPVRAVKPDTPIEDVYRTLLDRNISCVPVVAPEGRAIGVLSRTDLLKLGRLTMGPLGRAQALSWPVATAMEKMHHGVLTIPADASVMAGASLMVKHGVHRVFVAEDGRLTGVLSTKDILVAIREKRLAVPIGRCAAGPAFTIPVTTGLARAIDQMRAAHVSGLVVVDEDERPTGTFTQLEALLARTSPPETPLEDAMSYSMLCLHSSTPLHRAAAHAFATRARRVLVIEDRRVTGVLTGLDFARAVMAPSEDDVPRSLQ